MRVDVGPFDGEQPLLAPQLLDATKSQAAVNVDLRRGDLRPRRGLTRVYAVEKPGDHISLAKCGDSWIAWEADVDVVSTPTYNPGGRFVFTGDGEPKKSDQALALADMATAPSTAYGLGVPTPTLPLTVTLSPADPLSVAPAYNSGVTYSIGNYVLDSGKTYKCIKEITSTPAPAVSDTTYWMEVTTTEIAKSTSYVYTYVTGWGEEGAPSPETGVFDVLLGQDILLSDRATPPAGYNVTAWRIYRVVSGTKSGAFQFVDEVPIATATYADGKADSELNGGTLPAGGDTPIQPWDANVYYLAGTRVTHGGQTFRAKKSVTVVPGPATSDTNTWESAANLTGIVGLSNGILAAFIGNEIFLADSFRHYSWPISYSMAVEHEIVGCGHYGTVLVVLTKAVPFICDTVNPAQTALLKLPYRQACIAKRGIVSGANFVLFPSPDGLVMVSGGEVAVATAGVLTRDQWQALHPEDFVAFWHNDQYLAFRQGMSIGYVFSGLGGNSVTMTRLEMEYSVFGGYVDPLTDALYLLTDRGGGRSVDQFDAGAALVGSWRSKRFQLPVPASFAALRILGDIRDTKILFYGDDNLVHTVRADQQGVYRLPPGRWRAVEIEIRGADTVTSVSLVGSVMELAS